MSTRILASLALTLKLAALGCNDGQSSGDHQASKALCTTPLATYEPLCSGGFGDTDWPGSHRGSYAQGSSPLPGPDPRAEVVAEHIDIRGAPIIVSFTAPYEDGGRAIWATAVGDDAAIVKVDHESFSVIDTYVPSEREVDPPIIPVGVSGAYSAIHGDNRFIVGRDRFVSVFGDAVDGDRSSPIALLRRIFLPDEAFCGHGDVIAGISFTYDRQLTFVTERGNLFVIPADAATEDLTEVPVAYTNDECESTGSSDRVMVSNSIAVDEHGGIYVVTGEAVHRFNWNGTSLTSVWQAAYDSDEEVASTIRLGPGSGSTPSLMGTALDDDRFVLITDGQALMNLVLFWRDDIPADWEPIAPGKDRRIACEVPIRFGDPDATAAISEQSVAVRGYAAVVVNDLLTNPTIVEGDGPLVATIQNVISSFEGEIPEKAPFGLERVDWDPETRTCSTVWANPDVSMPNGVPGISATTGLVYGVGQRGGEWGLEGVDFETGASALWIPAGPGTCPDDARAAVSIVPQVAAVFEGVPNACENSIYAAATIAPDGMLYTGTFYGMTRYVPDTVFDPPADARVAAGIEQVFDLLNRASLDPGAGIGASEALGRAAIQLDATQRVAEEAGIDPVVDHVSGAQDLLRDALHALDQEEAPDLDSIRTALTEVSDTLHAASAP